MLLVSNYAALAKITVIDDSGYTLTMEAPAKRIISLAPHTTELIYAAGADQQVIAAVDFSNYPEKAKDLPRVGSGYLLDIEAIIGYKPDLIIGWGSGNQQAQLEKLKILGLSVYLSEPKTLEDIAENLRDLGLLLGESEQANIRANEFLSGINNLKKKHQHDKKVSVFYQVWNMPLFTVNGEHLISKVIDLCGGDNVFKSVQALSPQIDIESVLEKNPDVIVAGMAEGRGDWLNAWNKWPRLNAVKNEHVYAINADLIVRHTPRILQGARKMCDILDKVRNKNNPL